FSSALTTFVAASRLLSSMSENSIFFFNSFFSKKSKSGEPRNATIFTSLIIIITLVFGSLDTVAPLLTMVFLIAYSMINLVVFIEQSIGFVSFRPIFKIPKFVSLYGFLGSLFVMFYVNLISGIIAVIVLFLVYLILVRRRLKTKSGYVRSGLLLALSEWAAKKVISLSESKQQIWKPNILLPVISSRKLLGNFSIIKSLVYPNGELNILGIYLKKRKKIQGMEINKEKIKREKKAIPNLVDKFKKEGIFTSYASVSVENYINAVCTSLEAMEGQFFKPNILFLPVSLKYFSKYELKRLFSSAKSADSGMILFDKNNDIGLGSQEDIHVWLSPNILKEDDLYKERKYDLAMLSAYQLYRNWVGKITLRICVEKKNEDEARRYLRRLIAESRFPASTEIEVITDTFYQGLKESPRGDIHIIPVENLSEINKISKKTNKINKSFLFVVDSGNEDVLA
ncbi:hypothetical protein GF361_05880, partial [Candidatus Woesearchaeota archaeon]|nr:hypothetical protein [Candidatus Woesearchaeota archaeon]